MTKPKTNKSLHKARMPILSANYSVALLLWASSDEEVMGLDSTGSKTRANKHHTRSGLVVLG